MVGLMYIQIFSHSIYSNTFSNFKNKHTMRVKVTILLSIQYVAKETILKIGNKDHRKIELSQKCQAKIEI